MSYSSSSNAFDEESSKSSDSDDDASESESEDESDIRSQFASGGRKRGPSQPRCSNAKRKKSPAEVYHTNGKVTAHGLQWKFAADDVSSCTSPEMTALRPATAPGAISFPASDNLLVWHALLHHPP